MWVELWLSILSMGLLGMNATWADPVPLPASSIVDFSYLLDAPAGNHGIVRKSADGHFVLNETQKRIRFWGVSVANDNLFISHEEIDRVIDLMAKAGHNLLRLHELDNLGVPELAVHRGIFTNGSDTQHFDEEYRDRIHYWVAAAKKRGIYSYLVIRGYRQFKIGDGVAAPATKARKGSPYALFDRRLIDLQIEFAHRFLFEQKNPYTGFALGNDPAVAMIELVNEDSMLFEPERWSKLEEPYRQELKKLWNDYLKIKYTHTKTLKEAWGDGSLRSDENIGQANIELPIMSERSTLTQPLSHPARQSDGLAFGVELQNRYYRELREQITKDAGLNAPLMTATVNQDVPADTYAVHQNLDFIGQNLYFDHPAYAADMDWQGAPSFSLQSPLKAAKRLITSMARYAWQGVPIVVREWTISSPNPYRDSGMLLQTVASASQDYDGLIQFSYFTQGERSDRIYEFGIQRDPLRWGLSGYLAALFENGLIGPATQTREIVVPQAKLYRWPTQAASIDPSLPLTAKIRLTSPLQTNFDIPDSLEAVASPPLGWSLSADQSSLLIDTPQAVAHTGDWEIGKPTPLGLHYSLVSNVSRATAIVLALDGLSLEKSKHRALKWVTQASNTDQIVIPKPGSDRFLMTKSGTQPVLTGGKPAETPVSVLWKEEPLLKVFLSNGTWEAEWNESTHFLRITCDTPGIRFETIGAGHKTVTGECKPTEVTTVALD